MSALTDSTFKNKTAIAGIGYTQFYKDSGHTPLGLACRAILNGLEDAGLTLQDVDGLAQYSGGDSVPVGEVATAIGIKQTNWMLDFSSGGWGVSAMVGDAAMAIATGHANVVVVWRSLNGRSGHRLGGGVRSTGPTGARQWGMPYGVMTPAQSYAFWARRHMETFGTTSEHFGHIAVNSRKNAAKNPRATMTAPITLEDHQSSRWIVEPFHLLDCCLETDASVALVLTSAERARDLRKPPVYIRATGTASGPYPSFTGLNGEFPWRDHLHCYGKYVSPGLYDRAGIGPKDLSLAMVYDCFTWAVLLQLEDFGICPKGEGGPFVADGNIALDGTIPVNTNGGMLSEGYVHGLNHFIEATEQLRGEAGERQVPNAETALVTSWGATLGSATILSR